MNTRKTPGASGAARTPPSQPPVQVRRLEQGLTLVRLAQRCAAAGVKVSPSEISRIERRIHIPRPALRRVLADLLGLKVTDFDEGDENA